MGIICEKFHTTVIAADPNTTIILLTHYQTELLLSIQQKNGRLSTIFTQLKTESRESNKITKLTFLFIMQRILCKA